MGKSIGNCNEADQRIKRFDWLLRRKNDFDWLLRHKGSRVEKVLIGCCRGRDQMVFWVESGGATPP